MNLQATTIAFGCLLHDIGKLHCRRGSHNTHSFEGDQFLRAIWSCPDAEEIANCVRRHHTTELQQATLPPNSPAYVVWLANRIATSAEQRSHEENPAAQPLPLRPVFTHLNGEHPGYTLTLQSQDHTLNMPQQEGSRVSQADYARLCSELEEQLSMLPPEEGFLPPLLSLLERYTGTIPSGSDANDCSDISLFDHLKITAAIGTCIGEYLLTQGIDDYRKALLEQEEAFCSTDAFLLYSADFSGIQKFIYTVSTKKALQSLRSRSFFLELTMEHYLDELLMLCGLSRVNLLYSGGGHCYILLPNTEEIKARLTAWNMKFNNWLCKQFGIRLYLADAYTPCSAKDLTNTPAEKAPYKALFRRISSLLAKKKLHRYSAQQIIQMNQQQEDLSGRECRVCGRTDQLKSLSDGTDLCPWCYTFEQLSTHIQSHPIYLVLDGAAENADLILPTPSGEASYLFRDNEFAPSALIKGKSVRRIYTKNQSLVYLKHSIPFYVGDYAASNSMEELASQSSGIHRLAVCRMDLDDLGQAFVAGFERSDAPTVTEQQRFVTIARTAAFSRQMSHFFKLYITPLLSGDYGKQKPLQVTIVYSGGDDVFLVGAWSDTIQAALRIRNALQEFSCGALTISGGIGAFADHYPIRLAAAQTEELEAEAKERPGKNAVSLFAAGSGNSYSWKDFEEMVVGKKLKVLANFFNTEQAEQGSTFLYHIMLLLRQAQEDPQQKMPLARLAYLLARLEPPQSAANYAHYKEFSSCIFEWSLDYEERRQLITAIYLYVYANRKEEECHGE